MTTRRALAKRWAQNPRTLMIFALAVLAGAVVAFVISSGLTTRLALETRNKTAASASRRVDLLNEEIERLSTQVANGSQRIGQLAAEVSALQAQLERRGESPIVPRTTTTTPRPTSSTTSTTTTTRPRSTTTTTRPCSVSVPGVCLP